MFADEIDTARNVVWDGDAGTFDGRNGPDRFVGDDDLGQIFFGNISEARGELVAQDICSFSEGALGLGFADTENWGDVIANAGGDFFPDVFVRFAKDIATLGMANNTEIDKAAELGDGGLTGVGAKIFGGAVLSNKFDLFSVELERERLERNQRRRNRNLETPRRGDFL